MADAITGDTELVATKQDLVASLVQRELAAAAKLVPTVSDFSQFAPKGAKTVKVPRLDSFTAIDRASGVSGDATVLTASTDDIALDQCQYVAWIIDSCDEIQSNINSQMEFAARAASAHGRRVDSQLIAEMESTALTAGSAGDITRDIVLDMREQLLSGNADQNNLWLALGPDQEMELLKIAEFTRADIYGTSNIPDGMVGRVYGVNVMISNLIGADTYYMYDKGGVGIAFQQQPVMSSQKANEFGALAERHAMDVLYGTQLMQGGALVIKDGN